jgi:hypothetical protein
VIALILADDVVLAGIRVPEHRTIEVVAELPFGEPDGERTVLTAGEARALVHAGFAEPITADFEMLAGELDAWRR